MSLKLEVLLKKKDLDCRNWSLLYRGSRNEFRSLDFHVLCNGKRNTLTLVKSTNGNIFGGYVSLHWKSTAHMLWEYDTKAFLFSLVEKENGPLIFELSASDKVYVGSQKEYVPIFGGSNYLFVSNKSNTNTDSYSNLKYTYTSPEYPYGRATVFANTYNFQVQEIEVFQLQP